MPVKGGTVEAKIAEIAGCAHGVVTRVELLWAGVSRSQIEQRLSSGALIRVHRGVYRAGHRAPSIEATYMAAVKACGDGALLCGLAAAHLFGLLRSRAAPPPEVVAATERQVAGLRTHESRRIDQRETTAWRGIPLTSVARTLVDLAAVLDIDDLARACHEGGVRHRTTPAAVEAVLSRCPNRPGAGKLRKVLRGEVPVALSKLERRFLDLIRAAGLPLPETNRPAGGRRVDCRWPEQQLTVELDGFRYHNSRHAWELDRRREREARERGDAFRRYSYEDVKDGTRFILSELRPLFAATPAP